MEVKLFGALKDKIKQSSVQIADTGNAMTANELIKKVYENYPELSDFPMIKVAVNNILANEQTFIHNGDEVALLPPYAGG